MSSQARKRYGFTLVEILIVVVILGILAAIVVPQFTNASEEAKGSSTKSLLQTIRSQLQLYQIQHNGEYPPEMESPLAWPEVTGRTDAEGIVDPDGAYGPYLQQVPRNPFVSSNDPADHWDYDPDTGTITAVGFDEVSGAYTRR